jgi:hypothetical protein
MHRRIPRLASGVRLAANGERARGEDCRWDQRNSEVGFGLGRAQVNPAQQTSFSFPFS